MFVKYYNKWYGFWILLDDIIPVIILFQLLCGVYAYLILSDDKNPNIVKELTGIKQSKLRAILKSFIWYQIALLVLNICIMYKLQIFISEYLNHTNHIQTPIINIYFDYETFFRCLIYGWAFASFGEAIYVLFWRH